MFFGSSVVDDATVDPLVEDLVRSVGGSDDGDEPDVKQVRTLLKAGVDVNATSSDGRSALWVAVTGLHVEMVRLLLVEGGADVNLVEEEEGGGEASLLCYFLALLNLGGIMSLDGIDLPLSYGDDDDDDDDSDQEDQDREQAIVSIVRLLLEHGADYTSHDCNGMLPLHYASFLREDMPGIARALLEHGADPNLSDALPADEEEDDTFTEGRTTPLEYAVQEGNVETMRVLLKFGANPNVKDQEGSTSLHLLCGQSITQSCHKIEVLKELLAHGADSSERDMDGLLPLEVACESDDIDSIFELLKHGDFRRLTLGDSQRD